MKYGHGSNADAGYATTKGDNDNMGDPTTGSAVQILAAPTKQ